MDKIIRSASGSLDEWRFSNLPVGLSDSKSEAG